ncbi:MAG: metalloregulator ArsR/SmtB family transcription factor [Bacilli bacterium]|nr:metalloregulator ArsR/SmtB family transcription factor [Bacilli bacterium]
METSSEMHGIGDNVEELKKIIPDEETAVEAANIYSLLSDSTRLRILYLLKGRELCVLNISKVIKMSSPAISHHLKTLKQMKVITSKRIGQRVHYSISNNKEGKFVTKLLDTTF